MHVRLAAAARRCFGPGVRAPDAHGLIHHRDLAGSFGVRFDQEALCGGHHTHTEMCLEVVAALGDLAPPPGLVVLAHTVPDLDVAGYAAAAAAHRVGGEPLAFAIGDQGTAAPFTALRVAAEYLLAGSTERALVLLVDQSVLPYRVAVPRQHRPLVDTAVGLVLTADPGDGTGLVVRQLADVGPADVGTRLDRLVRELTPPGTSVTIVTGPGIDLGASAIPVTAGRPTTGLFDFQICAGTSVLVADYDKQLRYLCAAVIHDATRPHEEKRHEAERS